MRKGESDHLHTCPENSSAPYFAVFTSADLQRLPLVGQAEWFNQDGFAGVLLFDAAADPGLQTELLGELDASRRLLRREIDRETDPHVEGAVHFAGIEVG